MNNNNTVFNVESRIHVQNAAQEEHEEWKKM